jgi:phosphoserine phosphatase
VSGGASGGGPAGGGGAQRGFASVVFDCDSTLVGVEGIDELAGAAAERIAALTERAMTGQVPLEQVYGERLEIIRPHRLQLELLGELYRAALVPDAVETVRALLWLGKEVRLLSGGLLPPLLALADALGLPADGVAGVPIHLDDEGVYAGFDDASPLARSGGKEEVIRGWELPRPSLLVGDGATDLEARPAVDAFAAYTGVVHRPAVVEGADLVIAGPSLAPVLALSASEAERERLRASPFAGLLKRGEAVLAGSRADGAPGGAA